MDFAEIEALIGSWELYLRAERKSHHTLRGYTTGMQVFLTWCKDQGRVPELDKPTVKAFMADQIDQGFEATTVTARLRAVRRFSAWLAEEGEIDEDRIVTVKSPKIDSKVVPELSDEQARALIKACAGKEFRDRRDEAIVRLMLETAARAGEVVAMETDDVDLKAGSAVVTRGKGGKGRRVPIGPQTCRAIDRYLRMRRAHRLGETSALWLGDRGRTMGYWGLYETLKWRASLAGLEGLHPHILRHTAAGRWLAAGGSEGGLMAIAGWSTREMIDRYTRATSERRAAEEARRLNLGDL